MRRLRGKDSLLTGIILNYLISVGIAVFMGACRQPAHEKLQNGQLYGKIIYDTYIINRDSTDAWGKESLSGFNHKAFIDKIFNDVFDGRVTPYDYFTGEIIAIRKIREMESEKEFSRKNISKIQFEERWVWDNKKVGLSKQVISMTIAYEVYDEAGRSRGQKPIFKLVFRE